MLPYWSLFALFAAGAATYGGQLAIRERPTFLFAIACIATVAMIGLRLEVGGDFYSYLDFYTRMSLFPFAKAIGFGDPAYAAINWIVRRADIGMWMVNTICAAIFVAGLGRFALRQPNPWLAMLIAVPYLIIVVAMGYTRQAAALGFVMWGFAAFERGAVRSYAVSVLAAVTFHLTAIVLLPLGMLSVTRNKVLTSLLLILLTASLYFVLVQSNIDRLVANYVTAGYASQGALVRVAMNLPPALIFLAARNRFIMPPESRRLWTNFSIAALLCLVALIFSDASTAIDRLALYIIPLQIMVLSRAPSIFARSGRESLALVMALILYSAIILYVWLNHAQHADAWLPYNNYLWS